MIDREWCARQLAAAQSWHERARRSYRAAARARNLNTRWREELAAAGWGGHDVVWSASGREQHVVDERAPTVRARYAEARARSVALERSAVVASCGTRSIVKRCGCKGPTTTPVGCGQVLLCDRCRRPYYRRIRRRALAAVVARLAEATGRWACHGRRRGKRPAIVMVTLTVPRKLDGEPMSLADRRERLVDGWRKLRQWLHRRIGRFPFVILPELTPGSDGTGHLHYHAICIWPWWNWAESQAEWRRATGLSDANPPDMRVVKDPRKAAHYVAKYASKGTDMDDPAMSAELIADFVATFYGKRRITPSVGFWIPMPPPCCPTCRQAMIVVERPGPLAAAAAAWRARRGLEGIAEYHVPPPDRPWRQLAPDW